MWGTRMDEADADGELSDEEFARSTAHADERDSHESYLTKHKYPKTSEPLSASTDPVSIVLNKIDQELEAMRSQNKMTYKQNSQGRSYGGSERLASVQQQLPLFGNHGTETGVRYFSLAAQGVLDGSQRQGESRTTDVHTDRVTEEGDRERRRQPDTPRELDPFSAQEIDMKFKEIMRMKKGSTDLTAHPGKPASSPGIPMNFMSSTRPPTTMLSAGYGTDNESVQTEDFESKFLGMLVQPADTDTKFPETGDTTGDLQDRLAPETTRPEFTSRTKSIISRPRSLSPSRMRGEKKSVVIRESQDDLPGRQTEKDPIHIEIELQTARRSRSVPPTLASPGPGLARPTDHKTKTVSRPLSSSWGDDHHMQAADQEMNTYTQALQLTRKKLVEVHEELKSAREMAERAKSELLALEFKRGNASQELESLANEVTRKKGQMSALDSDLQVKVEEAKNMRSLGLTREDFLDIKAVKDENLSLKSKLRTVEGLQLERDELVRQLEAAKEGLFREQKLARDRSDELQEVIESLTAKLEEAGNNWRADQAQMAKLESSFKRMEREKNELIQEKTQENEALKASHKQETTDSQNVLKKELSNLDHEVQGLRAKVSDLQVELAVKDAMAEKLRSEINEIGSVLDRERQDRQKVSAEQKNLLQHLKTETAAAVLKLKESMLMERQTALEEVKRELAEDRREAAARSEERLAQVLEDHSYQLSDKNAEITRLEDIIRDLENYKQVEMEEQVREAVTRERELVELQKDRQMRQERDGEKKRSREMMAAIEKEKQSNRELLLEMSGLRKELEEQKRLQREAGKDKLVAVARAKDQMKEQGIAEMERVKFNLKQEHESEIDRMKERLRDQEEQVAKLKSELDHVSERERLALKNLEQLERMMVAEIHTQVQKVAAIAGISPRTAHPTSIQFDLPDGRLSPTSGNRPAISAALVSLQTCVDEVQHQMSQLQLEQASLRTMVKTVTKEKEEALNNCRLEMDRKRNQDLEKLKEKLLKEHVSEMSNVIRECAEANSQLKTNSQILQRYGDAALLEALQAKDDELQTMEMALAKWQGETEEKFNTQLQLQVAKEREKYQALQHHSTREQKRINDLQKREIDRLEKEVKKLATSTTHDSNRFVTSSPSSCQETTPTTSVPPSLPFPTSASNLKSSQQYLQNRIEQLQAENAALRKQRMSNSSRLSMSTSNLTTPTRQAFPPREVEGMQRLGDRIRHGQLETRQAEEMAKQNQKIMNNKMEEMAKLQNTLIIQNQELQELERSYNDLQKHYHSRPGSPTRNLNKTR